MHDDELGSKWVGSKISCYNLCIVVRDSICLPSWDVAFSEHHDLDLASPSIILQNGLNCLICFRSLSKLDKNSSNSVIDNDR